MVNECLSGIGSICLSAPIEHRQTMFASVIQTAQNKAFADWAQYGYRLLRQSAALVQNAKQAEAVYGTFAMLGTMYGGEEYPDRYWITQNMIERLEGAAAAAQYRMEHLHVAEIRKMVVEEAIASERYEWAEKLCLEALSEDKRHGQPSDWAYELERIYTLSANTPKLIEIVELILMKGARSYYPKLKKLYQADGTWEQRREPILQRLAKAYMAHAYAALLAEEGETGLLLGVIEENPLMIAHYGKQLAREFPVETYRVYEAYILNEAAEATDRRMYKAVCKWIKSYYDAGAKSEAKAMIQRLAEKYPRRVAMLDELSALDKKLMN